MLILFFSLNSPLFFFRENLLSSFTVLQKKILVLASIAFAILAAIYVIKHCWIKTVKHLAKVNKQEIKVNPFHLNHSKSTHVKNPDIEYLFYAQQEGRSQKGCCGPISLEIADKVRQKLQDQAAPGIFFDPTIYRRSQFIKGTCTAMSLEFASTYFRI